MNPSPGAIHAIAALILLSWPLGAAPAHSQQGEEPAKEVIDSINRQVWIPFEKAYAENDVETFFGLHTDDVVRVNLASRRVRQGAEYKRTSGASMLRRAQDGRSGVLDLRFTQRVHGAGAAWETGVYRFESKSDGTVSFGEFTVVLQKVHGTWRIAVDADEPSTKANYDAAREMSETDW